MLETEPFDGFFPAGCSIAVGECVGVLTGGGTTTTVVGGGGGVGSTGVVVFGGPAGGVVGVAGVVDGVVAGVGSPAGCASAGPAPSRIVAVTSPIRFVMLPTPSRASMALR